VRLAMVSPRTEIASIALLLTDRPVRLVMQQAAHNVPVVMVLLQTEIASIALLFTGQSVRLAMQLNAFD